MELLFHWTFMATLVIFTLQTEGTTCPDIKIPDRINATESDLEGTVLLELNITDSMNQHWNVSEGFEYLAIQTNNSKFIIKTAKNLHNGFDDYKGLGCLSNIINVTFTCDANPSEKVSSFLFIKPVNNNDPVVRGKPFACSIPETTDIGETVFQLAERVTDEDCPKTTFTYSMGKYFLPHLDGSKYFSVNKTSGNVTLTTKLDSSDIQCKRSAIFFLLNITVQDTGDIVRQSSSILNITVSEVDDEPPVFVNKTSCKVCDFTCRRSSYQSQISTSFEGTLPTRMYAKDFDTEDAKILYRIVKAEPEDLAFLIDLDENSGNLTVPVAPVNYTNVTVADDFGLLLTIQAIENKTQEVSENVTLKVTFIIPTTTTTTTTTTKATTTIEETTQVETTELSTTSSTTTSITMLSPSTSTITSTSKPSYDVLHGTNVLVIVLPVIFGVLLIIMIIAIIYQYKQTLPAKGKTYEIHNGEIKSMTHETIKINSL